MTDYTIKAELGISLAHLHIEREILATRTSERSNLLTEANICLLLAQAKLDEIKAMDSGRIFSV